MPIPYLPAFAVGAAIFRIVDIIQVSINIVLFNRLRVHPDLRNPMISLTRSLLLTVINYFELILLFGVIYLSYPEIIHPRVEPYDALYFSVITQITIGYGDLRPVGWGRLVASIQGITGFFFAIFVLARFISSLPSIDTVVGDGPNDQTSGAVIRGSVNDVNSPRLLAEKDPENSQSE